MIPTHSCLYHTSIIVGHTWSCGCHVKLHSDIHCLYCNIILAVHHHCGPTTVWLVALVQSAQFHNLTLNNSLWFFDIFARLSGVRNANICHKLHFASFANSVVHSHQLSIHRCDVSRPLSGIYPLLTVEDLLCLQYLYHLWKTKRVCFCLSAARRWHRKHGCKAFWKLSPGMHQCCTWCEWQLRYWQHFQWLIRCLRRAWFQVVNTLQTTTYSYKLLLS